MQQGHSTHRTFSVLSLSLLQMVIIEDWIGCPLMKRVLLNILNRLSNSVDASKTPTLFNVAESRLNDGQCRDIDGQGAQIIKSFTIAKAYLPSCQVKYKLVCQKTDWQANNRCTSSCISIILCPKNVSYLTLSFFRPFRQKRPIHSVIEEPKRGLLLLRHT